MGWSSPCTAMIPGIADAGVLSFMNIEIGFATTYARTNVTNSPPMNTTTPSTASFPEICKKLPHPKI